MWGLILKIGLPIVAVIGIYTWISVGAYNRGVRDRDAEAVKVIAEQKKAVIADAEAHRRMTPAQLDDEFKKKCRRDGGSEEQCR